MAAVLACGEGAVLSHGSAAALWGLLRPLEGPLEVTVPTAHGRARRRGIRLHRCASLATPGPPAVNAAADGGGRQPASRLVTRRLGIPVTTVARTIADLRRSSLPPRLVRRAIRQAEVAGYPLGPAVETDGSRSDFETSFISLSHRAGLPVPLVNERIGRWLVDFHWPRLRLAVETDSYKFHRGSVAFEDDHARDLDLRARGYEVRRYTEHQVFEESALVLADLEKAAEDRSPAASSLPAL